MKASEPKEYWINVYDGIFGARHPNRKDSDRALKIFGADYRIHVKMDGGYNKRFGKDLFYQRIWKDGQSVFRTILNFPMEV